MASVETMAPNGDSAHWARPAERGSGVGSIGATSRSGVSLPNIPSQPLLSEKRASEEMHNVRVAAAGGIEAPHSARTRVGGAPSIPQRPRIRPSPRPGATDEKRSPPQHQRAKSEDSRRAPAREAAPKPPNSADDKIKTPRDGVANAGTRRGASGANEENFLNMVVDIFNRGDADGDMGVSSTELGKLEVQAGSSKRLQEVTLLLQDLRTQLEGPVADVAQPQEIDQPMDTQSLAAQASYLEKKIVRLREKLKRRTKEVAQLVDGQQAPGELDVRVASVDELLMEIKRLQVERERLDTERGKLDGKASSRSPKGESRSTTKDHDSISPRSHSSRRLPKAKQKEEQQEEKAKREMQLALKRRLASMNSQMKELVAEKATADSNAEVAQALAQKVEVSMQEAVLARETERIKLEAEREVLQRRIEDQDNQIAQMEGVGINRQELDQLRGKVAAAERELGALRRDRQRLEDTIAGETIGGQDQSAVADRPGPRNLSLLGGPGSKPAAVLVPATPVIEENDATDPVAEDARHWQQSDYQDLVKSHEKTLEELRSVSAQLEETRAKSDAEIRELEKELEHVNYLAERAKHRRRRDLANDYEGRTNELEMETTTKLNDDVGVDSEAVKAARRDLEEHQARLQAEFDSATENGLGQTRYLESMLSFQHQEMVRSREYHQTLVRRQRDLRGRFFLAIRSWQPYSRPELLHYLCCTLGLRSGQLSVLEEHLVPGDTHVRQLARVQSKVAPPCDGHLDFCIRPLPEVLTSIDKTDTTEPPQDIDDPTLDPLQAPQDTDEPTSDPLQGAGEVAATVGTGTDDVIDEGQPEADEAGVERGVDNALSPENEGDCIMRRLLFEVLPEPESKDNASKKKIRTPTEVVDTLIDIVGNGGSLLEDVGVVGVCGFRGSASFDAHDATWFENRTRYIKKGTYEISGEQFVVSVFHQLEPCAVKIIATQPANNLDFVICFDNGDLEALLGERSILYKSSELGYELVDLLVSMLHLIRRPDEKLALVALHAVPAPQTELNALPSQQHALPIEVPVSSPVPLHTLPLQPVQEAPTALVPQAATETREIVSFEELLCIADRFFTLSVCDVADGGETRVRLQETGNCRAFEIRLLAHRNLNEGPRVSQLRACAQVNEFPDLTLMLAAEDIPMPPALVIRLARVELARPLAFRDPEQRVYWLSRLEPQADGNICRCLLGEHNGLESKSEDMGPTVSVIPTKHRARLLHAVHTTLRSGFVAGQVKTEKVTDTEKGVINDADSVKNKLLDELQATSWFPEYGNDSSREGVVLRDPTTSKPMREATAAQVQVKLLHSSDETGLRPLLKMGRRVPAPGGDSHLCVITLRQIAEPYLHFTVTAEEVGSCRSWSLLVDSLHVFRKLRMRSATGAKDTNARKNLARLIVQHLELESVLNKDVEEQDAIQTVSSDDASGSLRLVLRTLAEEDTAPVSFVAVASMMAASTTSKHGSSNIVLAPQVLAQETAAQYIANMQRYCILRGMRPLGQAGWRSEVYMFDEPDAPEASFMVNNLLIIVSVRGVYFSLRLHDKALQHPLLPEEMILLEPDNRRALLHRIFGSLDIITTSGQQSGSAERLVMQPFLTVDEVPDFEPDETGLLCPTATLSSRTAPLPLLDRPGSGAHASTPTGPPSPSPSSSAAGKQLRAMVGPQGAVYIGGCTVDKDDVPEADEERKRVILARRPAEWGDSSVELFLFNDCSAHAHVFELRQLGGADPDAGLSLEVQIPTDGDPSRVYVEQRTFAGEPLLIGMMQQAFPHEVRVVLFDPKSHEELELVARDDEILPLVERSLRERLSDGMDQLAKFGTLGVNGTPALCRAVNAGRELFPSDFRERALQNHTPIVDVHFSQLAHEMSSDLVTSRELVFSCSRYVVSPAKVELAAKAAPSPRGTETTQPEDVDLESAPLIRLSLSKKSYCGDFTFSIENSRGDAAESHMLHIRDKLSAKPLALYGEVQKVGDLRFLVIFLDDYAPRALRIGVIEPHSGWSFQLIVLDSDTQLSSSGATKIANHAGSPGGAYLKPLPLRHELLQLFRRKLSARRGLEGFHAPLAKNAHLQLALQPQLELQKAPSQEVTEPSFQLQRREVIDQKVVVLKRETRFLPNDDVALICVSYEFGSDGMILFKTSVAQPSVGRENHRLLVNPDLDRLLQACDLPPARELKPDMLEPQAVQKKVAEMALSIFQVAPTLDIEFSLHKIPRPDQPSKHTRSNIVLDCDEQSLLGQKDRSWSSVDAVEDGTESASLRIEVFDAMDSIEALARAINLRLRVTDLASGRMATRDVHEEELEPWLERAGATHLLCASREMDLVDMLLRHATFAEPGKEDKNAVGGVLLTNIIKEECTGKHFEIGFLESKSAEMRASRRKRSLS